jgi:hypothetical protein
MAEELAELLYGESGLGLNIYRYNIGAGWDENNCRVDNPWRRVESFYIYDDDNENEHYHGGGYDWERDKTAYNFMKFCLDRGRIDTVVLFANSPHYAFTASGQASGGIMHHTTNLPKCNYRRFVDYFLDITEHFINDGVPVPTSARLTCSREMGRQARLAGGLPLRARRSCWSLCISLPRGLKRRN